MRAVALLILIVALASGCAGSEPSITVPLLVGLRGPLAEQVAREADLDVEVEQRSDSGTRKGFVVWQSIREGTKMREGDTPTIWVSTGPS